MHLKEVSVNTPEALSSKAAYEAEDGAIAKMVKKLFLRSGNIIGVERVSKDFLCIAVQGESLKNVQWTPGDKIQVTLGAGFSKRTYTPMSWDAIRGATRFLAYLHGNTPACKFLLNVQPAMSMQFLGPRASLDLSQISPDPILFGDETCFGLAAALAAEQNGKAASFIFEVENPKEANLALRALGISTAVLIERKDDAQHLPAVFSEMQRQAQTNSQFILTGNAASIQMIKKSLLGAGVGNTRMKAKAYWAIGRSGLD